MGTRLTPVEAVRTIALLNEAVERLFYVSSLAKASSSRGGDELTAYLADEVARHLSERRSLEAEHESLLRARDSMQGLTRKAERQVVQTRIKAVSFRLKETNRTLCRVLRETPDQKSNAEKLAAERERVLTFFSGLQREVRSSTFNQLTTKVAEEQKENGLLAEVKEKEARNTGDVRRLEEEISRQKKELAKEQEIEEREISALNVTYSKGKIVNALRISRMEKNLKAQESAQLRLIQQHVRGLETRLEKLQQEHMETAAANRAVRQHFDEEAIPSVTASLDEWGKKMKDLEQADKDLDDIKAARETNLAYMQNIRECLREEREDETKKDGVRRREQMLSALEDNKKKIFEASTLLLQEVGRKYIARRAEEAANKKGKKKKKKK